MKRKNTSFVLLSVLILTLFFGVFSVNGLGASTIEYDFEDGSIYDSTNPLLENSVNMRNSTYYNGHFPATYSFEGETNLSGTDISFIDVISDGSISKINNTLDGHEEVLYFNPLEDFDTLRNEYIPVENGIIEFWMYKAEFLTHTTVSVREGVYMAIEINWNVDRDIEYYVDGVGYTDIGNWVEDEWMHYEIEFESNLEIFDFYQNGIKLVNNARFRNDVAHDYNYTSSFFFGAHNNNDDGEMKIYVDAIGYYFNIEEYNFDNELIDYFPQESNWNDRTSPTHNISVRAVKEGRLRVLEFFDNGSEGGGAECGLKSNLTLENGVVSFDVLKDRVDQNSEFTVAMMNDSRYESGKADFTSLYLDDNDLKIWDGGWVYLKENCILANTWYNLKFEFDDISQTFAFYFNNVYEGTFNYEDEVLFGGLTDLDFQATDSAGGDYSVFFDNIIIGDSNYSLGDNKYSEISIDNSTKEVDRYEFAYEDVNHLYDLTDLYPKGWILNDYTDINFIADGTYDRALEFWSSNVQTLYAKKECDYDYIENGNIFNITYSINFEVLEGEGSSYQWFYVRSEDSTTVLFISFRESIEGMTLYRDQTTPVMDGLNIGDTYEINLYIDYIFDICIMRVKEEGVLVLIEEFPLNSLGKTGISQISCNVHTETGEGIKFVLDYVGIYNNQWSLVDDAFGHLEIHINESIYEYYHMKRTNLFEIDVLGEIEIITTAFTYEPEDAIETVKYQYNYSGYKLINTIKNEFNETWLDEGIHSPIIIFFVLGMFEINSLSIEGVKLVSEFEYWLEFTSEGVNIEDSYFYVENEKMYFNLKTDDSNLEYIQAEFNINNVIAENRSVSFTSNIDGDSNGYFRVNYTDETSTFIPIPPHSTTTSVVIPQEKGVESLIILITDLDEKDSLSTSGYVYKIKLVYYPDISITIITQSLIDIIVPLMILLTPSFAIYKKFGASAVIPMFMFMSIVCFIAELIPVWLFFILMIGSVIMLFAKKEIEVF